MQFPKGAVYISPLAIQLLWEGLQSTEPTLYLSQDGSFHISIPRLDEQVNADIEFAESGTYKQALAYDFGRLHTEQKNAVELHEARSKYSNLQNLVRERIVEVRESVSPTISPQTKEKIDHINATLDKINVEPQIAVFGKYCARERELLDRCYLGNSRNTLACHDFAMSFQKCVFPNGEHLEQQQNQ